MFEKGYKQTESHKRKIGIALKGNQNAVGCNRSEETKKRIGDKNRNNPNCAWSKDKHLFLEHRQNISNSSKKTFTKEQEIVICKQYFDEKISAHALSKKYNCGTTAIRRAIKRNGFSLRGLKEAQQDRKQFTTDQEIEICQRYFDEISVFVLAKKWNCNSTTIRHVVIRNGFVPKTCKEAQIQRLLNYDGPYKNTKPELKMKEILNFLNIPFKHQFRIKNHLYDFHILNTNILIEVDGDYWHGNSKMFKKLNKVQKESKQRDKKHNKIAKTNNYILLRFWENDILRNEEKIKEKICKVINL